jgi:hypothetical protein
MSELKTELTTQPEGEYDSLPGTLVADRTPAEGAAIDLTLAAPVLDDQHTPTPEELFESAKQAVLAFRRTRIDPKTNRFLPGDTRHLKHGLHSQQLRDQPDIAAWHKEEVAAITADRGGEAEQSTLARGCIREVARCEIILAALGGELLEGGVLTGKGKTRAVTGMYLKVLDRYVNLIRILGLERRTKPVDLAQAFAEQERSRG